MEHNENIEKDFWKSRLARIPDGFHFRQIGQSYPPDIPAEHEVVVTNGELIPLLGALFYLLYKYSGKETICIDWRLSMEDAPERTMPLIADIPETSTVVEYLASLKELVALTRRYARLPFSGSEYRDSGTTNVLLVTAPGRYNRRTNEKYDLIIGFENNGPSTVRLDGTGRFRLDFLRVFGDLLRKITENIRVPDSGLSSLLAADGAEKERLLNKGRSGKQKFSGAGTIVGRFEETVRAHFDDPALYSGGEVFTYSAISEASGQLANYFRDTYQTRKGDIIGVLADRSHFSVIAMLGIMKAGGIYLPIDTAWPADRLAYIIKDSGLSGLLIQSGDFARLSPFMHIPMLAMDLQWPAILSHRKDPVDIPAPADAAYIIYTSGSTGTPKGVVLTHAGFTNMISDQAGRLGIKAGDRVLQFAPISFDASLWEMGLALLSGAQLVIAPGEVIADRDRFIRFLEQHRVNIATLPPSYLNALDHHPLPTLETIITAGEDARPADATFYAGTQRYFNAYGPSEASVCASLYKLDDRKEYDKRIPIGRPVANMNIYLLDEHLSPAPESMAGTIYLSGIGIATGYRNNPRLTQECFVADPFEAGRIMYCTGDLGVWLPDGELEFLGRQDRQIKARGFRIEPGEIEHALLSYREIKEAFVTALGASGEDKTLAAYIVADKSIDPGDLHSFLSGKLPPFMLPSRIIQLQALPYTTNGKIDLARLREMSVCSTSEEPDQPAPENSIIAELTEIWKAVLERKEIGVLENFYTIGGDSLKLIKVSTAINSRYGNIVEVPDLFQAYTLRHLSELVEARLNNSKKEETTLLL
jgi:amino acid adenylation domain-containing protein